MLEYFVYIKARKQMNKQIECETNGAHVMKSKPLRNNLFCGWLLFCQMTFDIQQKEVSEAVLRLKSF